MGAAELESWSEWRIQSRDLVRRSELNARVSEDSRWDLDELKSSYRTCRKEKSPAQPERLLQNSGQCFSMPPVTCHLRGWGLGTREKRIEPVRTLSLLERLLCRVRSSGAAPLAWHHSSGAPLHKSNKAGPQGKESRFMCCLSIGKQFFKVLLDEKGRVDAARTR